VTLRSLVPLAALAALSLAAAGCGSSSGVNQPTVGAAKVFHFAGFEPTKPVEPGAPSTITFTVDQPSGQPLTRYRTGAGPHTGVHLIYVREDLGAIIHHHPPIAADGKIVDHVTFPSPGKYRLITDVYPALAGPLRNFQLFENITVAGSYKPKPLPPFSKTDVVDGYRFTMQSKPKLAAIEPAFFTVHVTAPNGSAVKFRPWFGALAHAIFVRAGSLDYFHTHVCAPGAVGCTSILGASKVSGTSTTPGVLKVGVLLPVPGRWRLFLQIRDRGHVLTAPYTLDVR
jgi:hypothetical protein